MPAGPLAVLTAAHALRRPPSGPRYALTSRGTIAMALVLALLLASHACAYWHGFNDGQDLAVRSLSGERLACERRAEALAYCGRALSARIDAAAAMGARLAALASDTTARSRYAALMQEFREEACGRLRLPTSPIPPPPVLAVAEP